MRAFARLSAWTRRKFYSRSDANPYSLAYKHFGKRLESGYRAKVKLERRIHRNDGSGCFFGDAVGRGPYTETTTKGEP